MTAIVAAVATLVAAAAAPRVGRLSAADLVLAMTLPWLWPVLIRAPVPTGVARAGAAWVIAAAASALVALAGGAAERPHYLVLVPARSLEVTAALALGAAAATTGGTRAIQGALFVSAAAMGAFGTVRHVLPDWSLGAVSGERALRTFERGLYRAEANHFAGLFAIAIATALPVAAGREAGPLRRAARLALVLAIAGLLTTGSRLGLLAALAGAAIAATAGGPRPRRLAAVVALGIAVLLPGAFVRRIAVLTSALAAPAGPTALSDRAANWSLALDAFTAHPLLGCGPGTRNVAFHDSELLLALEGGGLLGAGTLVALAAVLWVELRRRGDAGALGALGAMCVLGLGSVSFHLARVALPFAIVAGASLAGCGRPPLTRGREPTPRSRP